MDAYEPLVSNSFTENKRPIKDGFSDNEEEESKTDSIVLNETISKSAIVDNDNENDNETNNEMESQNNENSKNFEEEDLVNLGDEGIDPDLKAELNKDIEADERKEKNIDNIKKGVDYGNGFAINNELISLLSFFG